MKCILIMSSINLKINLVVAMTTFPTNILNMLKCVNQAINTISKPMPAYRNLSFSVKVVTG